MTFNFSLFVEVAYRHVSSVQAKKVTYSEKVLYLIYLFVSDVLIFFLYFYCFDRSFKEHFLVNSVVIYTLFFTTTCASDYNTVFRYENLNSLFLHNFVVKNLIYWSGFSFFLRWVTFDDKICFALKIVLTILYSYFLL
jgi:hypothetical protein